MKKLRLAVLCLLPLLLLFSGCGTVPAKAELSRLVGEALLEDNDSLYYGGECSGEGHDILGTKVSGSRLTVYALTMYGNYAFRNDMFIKISGSGVIPAVLTFEKDGEEYALRDIEYPMDGAYYIKSIKKLFPRRYHTRVLHCEKQSAVLSEQERVYARAYLDSLGREAEIGGYADLHTVLLTELGVSTEVSNRLIIDKALGDYPFWVGTAEELIGGVRYVRSVSLDEAAGQIVYMTVEKDSGAVTDIHVFDAATGEEQ